MQQISATHSRALAAIVSIFVHAPTPPGRESTSYKKPGIGEFALQNHGSYARRHGYLHLTQANLSTVKARQYVAMIYPLAWAKLWLLMELFTDERFASVEFWAWLDADAFVVRHDWTLQSVFKRANGKPGCSVIVSWDIGYDDEARAWLSETERVAGSHNMKAARPFDKYRYIFNTGVMLLRNELNTIDLLTRAMDMAVRERYRSDWEQGAFTDLYLDHLHVRKVLCPVDRHLLQGMVKLPEDRELVYKARVWVAHVTGAKLDKSGVQALLSGAYQRRMKYSTPTGQKSWNSSFRDSSRPGVGQVLGHRSALGADGLQGASAQVDGRLTAAIKSANQSVDRVARPRPAKSFERAGEHRVCISRQGRSWEAAGHGHSPSGRGG